ncbi:hypothetical protein ACFWMX_15955 [Streptomyces sp. NPDC058378]
MPTARPRLPIATTKTGFFTAATGACAVMGGALTGLDRDGARR